MNEYEKHELRIKYLDVLLKNGQTLYSADKYIDERLEYASASQKEAIKHAIDLTAIAQLQSKEVPAISLEEQIMGEAYVAGDRFRTELWKEQEDKRINEALSKIPSGDTDWKTIYEQSKKINKESVDDKLQLFNKTSKDLVTSVENDEIKIPPSEIQKSFDFVNPSPGVPVKESNANISDTKPQSPVMVNPKDTALKESPKKSSNVIQESKSERMGQPQEIPLRYEDRIKQAQR